MPAVARRTKKRTHHAKNRKIPAEVAIPQNLSAKSVQDAAKNLKNIQAVIVLLLPFFLFK